MSSLSELAKGYVCDAMHCIRTVIKELTKGSILMKTLHILLSNQEQFLRVVKSAGLDSDMVKKLLIMRELELKAFQSASTHLTKLYDHCQKSFETGKSLFMP